jgi:hypothetical protein
MNQRLNVAIRISVVTCAATALACSADARPNTGEHVVNGAPIEAQSVQAGRTEVIAAVSERLPTAALRERAAVSPVERMVRTHAANLAAALEPEGSDVGHGSGAATK